MALPTPGAPHEPHEGSPAAARRARLYGAVLVVAVLGFISLAALADTHQIFRFDVAITRALQSVHVAFYRWVMVHESDLGFEPLSPLTYIAVFIALFAARLRVAAVLGVISSLLASGVGDAIKNLTARARPSLTLVHVAAHLHSYSFPSGHVIHYTTLFGFALYIVVVAWKPSRLARLVNYRGSAGVSPAPSNEGGRDARAPSAPSGRGVDVSRAPWKPSAPRALVAILLALLIILVGPSRVYLGEHWPTDVTGGYLLGGVWLAATIWVYRRLAVHRRGWFQARELERTGL